jgi:hypothetical protein
LPWGEWNGRSVDFPEALADLFLPGFFGSFVDGVIKAPDQRVDQGGPRFGRQCQCISEYVDGLRRRASEVRESS